MTAEEINELVTRGKFPFPTQHIELVETHISWVLIGDEFVYKIKKPMHYSFLDFSTLEKRKHYCEEELRLNRRLAREMYLDVYPVKHLSNGFSINGSDGEVMDYAVCMKKIDRHRQMDVLLKHNMVRQHDIHRLARKVGDFHLRADVIKRKDVFSILDEFKGITEEKDHLNKVLGQKSSRTIDRSVYAFEKFVEKNHDVLPRRLQEGFFRDGHGDLHSRNIFLLPEPVIFDCIEFSEDFRQIDVLNEVAFLCMDLEALGMYTLANSFLQTYNQVFTTVRNVEEKQLFVLYKIYRANVRAKVNSLRSKNAADERKAKASLAEASRYLQLMDAYLDNNPEIDKRS